MRVARGAFEPGGDLVVGTRRAGGLVPDRAVGLAAKAPASAAWASPPRGGGHRLPQRRTHQGVADPVGLADDG
ncbi:hypothetical protein, partial [Pseudonocardia sp. ICBG601]|uniref:hypothetical protein n=1 Tax=Pseudonocardia sp. ICBG601 TaxID=2846759 RepID=UPI001CF6C06A